MNIYFLNNTFLIAQFLSAIFLLVVFIYAIFQASKVVNLSLLMLENEYLDTSNMATAYVSLAGSMFVFFCGAFAQAIMFDSGINNEPSVFYIITNTFSLCVNLMSLVISVPDK